MPLRTSATAAVSPPIPAPTIATPRPGRLPIESRLGAGAAGRCVEVARAEGDPLGLRPVRMELAHRAVELRGDLVLGSTLAGKSAGLATQLFEVFARGDDHAGVADLSVAGHDDCRLEAFELLQHGDPVVAADVAVAGRKDREAPALDEIAREHDPLLREEDDLVAARMTAAERAKLRAAAPERDLGRSLVDELRLDELDVLELFRNCV